MNHALKFLYVLFLLTFGCNSEALGPQPVVEIDTGQVEEEPPNPNPDAADYHLLFIGNSLTYYNDLPNLVKTNALEKGISLEVKMIAKPNYAIVDHWDDGEVQKQIKTGVYDFVILQQGPSSQSNGYAMLVNDGRKYAELCALHGSRLAYFMVWPSRRYYHTFDGVIRNYSAGARANNAILCPVGTVWKKYFDDTGDFSYYGPDEFHPSFLGSQVAADVIVNSLFK